jgi:hypothetical protein
VGCIVPGFVVSRRQLIILFRLAMKNLLPKIRLYLLDIPATLVLAPLGFMLEFVVTLPFMLACELDGLFRGKR